LRHRLEGFSQVILIQSRHDDSFSHVGELIADIHELGIEKLTFIDTDNLSPMVHFFQNFRGVANQFRFDAHFAMRDDVVASVSAVDLGFENLNPLAGDLSAA
jgi:hypothetical protein